MCLLSVACRRWDPRLPARWHGPESAAAPVLLCSFVWRHLLGRRDAQYDPQVWAEGELTSPNLCHALLFVPVITQESGRLIFLVGVQRAPEVRATAP